MAGFWKSQPAVCHCRGVVWCCTGPETSRAHTGKLQPLLKFLRPTLTTAAPVVHGRSWNGSQAGSKSICPDVACFIGRTEQRSCVDADRHGPSVNCCFYPVGKPFPHILPAWLIEQIIVRVSSAACSCASSEELSLTFPSGRTDQGQLLDLERSTQRSLARRWTGKDLVGARQQAPRVVLLIEDGQHPRINCNCHGLGLAWG